ncbi:MAG: aspartate aminotransferase family protein [Deltaproteobacteria bacterium]|nr:aspartate aminotransferase family protein [Deltaproteobacteria bacterium]
MLLEVKSLILLRQALGRLEEGFKHLPGWTVDIDLNDMRTVLSEVAERMQDNFPYQHPFYAGQMLKPPHPIARLAYMLSLWINPNNHALDGGRASSAMEKEAVGEIAKMFGWETHVGHLCGGGTMANLEALWISRCRRPGSKIVASTQAHYTHQRLCDVLNIFFEAIPCDRHARMDLNALEAMLKEDEVGTVVATIGTTATGSVDPLAEICALQREYGFRIHVDAAYGGYFTLADSLGVDTRRHFDCLAEVDSIAIDPHKHGLQPYGCGCIIFKDPSVGMFYKHSSPYTYFTSDELHLGEISLECSRAGASAVALWATQKLLPLVKKGTFAGYLDCCRQAALRFFRNIEADPRFLPAFSPELDIICWAPRANRASRISELSTQVFEKAASENLHLALVTFSEEILAQSWQDITWDQDHVTCLRSCLMKPEHLDWIDRIWGVVDDVAKKINW